MDPVTIVKLVVIAGIFLIVVSIGLRARPSDALALVRQPVLGARAMVAMFVAVPAFVLMITAIFPINQALRAALLAISVSPMPPILPKKEIKAGADGDYTIGLQVLATLVSIAVVPFMLLAASAVFGVSGNFPALAMSKTLAITVGVPLAVGMAVGKYLPDQRDSLAGLAGRLGGIAIAIGGAAILVTQIKTILALIGGGALMMTTVIIGFALLVGHLLGGPDEGNRTALAVAASARHPGVAITLATAVFPEHAPEIVAIVLLFLLSNIVLTIPYLRWRQRHREGIG
jgi:BASS family bile acid:Na+ symporter